MRERWPVVVVAVGLVLYGGYCLVQIPTIWEEAERVPDMKCEQLVQAGPGAQRFVRLTDMCLSAGRSVSQRDSENGALEMYHPVYAAGLPQEPAPRDLALIVCIMDEHERRRIRDDRDRRKQAGQPGLSGLTCAVQKGTEKLPPWAREGLWAKYPGIQLANCWVLTVGANEPTPARARTMLWHGLVTLPAGVALGWLAWRRVPALTPAETT
jgi:hypothetical protein